MADRQRKIKPAQKRSLFEEAGGKCANPGCANWRSHIHHIKSWSVYRAHNSADMIAVCPSCHDACHYGRLKISDETLYAWKGIVRPAQPDTTHVYVEPGQELKLIAGSIAFAARATEASIFQLANGSHLTMRILDGDLLQVSAKLMDLNGREVFRVVENHVRVNRRNAMQFEQRPGHVRVTVRAADSYAPAWLLDQVRTRQPQYAANGRIVVLDVAVLRPSVVRIQGCWPSGDVGVVVTDSELSLCRKGRAGPISYRTSPTPLLKSAVDRPDDFVWEPAVVEFVGDGPVTLFGFLGGPPSVICDKPAGWHTNLAGVTQP